MCMSDYHLWVTAVSTTGASNQRIASTIMHAWSVHAADAYMSSLHLVDLAWLPWRLVRAISVLIALQ